MFRLTAIVAATVCAACGSGPKPRAKTQQRPNVIVVLTDDQGYGDLGVYGNPVLRTPSLDAMAARSARFEQFYVSPVCAPTRASLMTGRYHYRTRVVDTWLGRAMMDPDERTIAEYLGEAGYATGIFGKWHLGDCYPMRPMDQGFLESLVHRGGGIGQPSDPEGGEGKYTDPVLFENGKRIETHGYCTDVYFDAAKKWLLEKHAEGKPFFAYIATNAPHGPFDDVPEALYRHYRAQDLSNERFPRSAHPLPARANTDRRARIFAMIENIDTNVGKLQAVLEQSGLADNTIVVFLSDNGPNGRRFNAGMRGIKTSVYEGGVRVPCFVQWPARVGPHTIGTPAAHIDLLPTLLDACGVAPKHDPALDGRSLLPLLTGEQTSLPDRALFIQVHRGDQPQPYHNFLARTHRWKLVNASGFARERLPGRPKFELYDMLVDPLETKNVAAQHADVVTKLLARYDAWFLAMSNSREHPWQPPRIHVGSNREPVTVLTRQDWRVRTRGHGWGAADHTGYWSVFVSRPGRYSVEALFRSQPEACSARLRFGPLERSQECDKGATSCRFDDLQLESGNARIEVILERAGRELGIWKARVKRTD